jgi:hypothetical protein
VSRLLGELAAELRAGRYRPLSARRVFIPKPGTRTGLDGSTRWHICDDRPCPGYVADSRGLGQSLDVFVCIG